MTEEATTRLDHIIELTIYGRNRQNGNRKPVVIKEVDIPIKEAIRRPPVVESPAPPAPEPILPHPSGQYPVDPVAVADLYDRATRPAQVGEINRKTLTYTITPQTDDEWRDFLETHTGTRPQRGKGISSPMVELSMQVLMALVANFKLSEVASNLRGITASELSREQIRTNLTSLAEQLV